MQLDAVMARIASSGEIPTIGAIASEVVRLVYDRDGDARAIGRALEKDPALTARVLRLANSPYYGARAQVSSLDRAVGLLGTTEIRNIALSVSVMGNFSARFGGQTFDWARFWEHSSGCALIAQVMARLLGIPTSGGEYVAGLLHDVGKILLGHHFPEEFSAVLELASREGVGMEEAENRVFGTDHGRLGDWLSARWCFPPPIREAIAHHHHPEQASEAGDMASLVHLADLLAKAKCIGFGGDVTAVCVADSPAWNILVKGRPKLAALDLERLTFCLDREVDAARELIRTAGDG